MPKGSPPAIGIISLSVIPDDPRVRRQGDIFAQHGWDVVAIGLPGARSKPPAWRYIELCGRGRTSIASGAEAKRSRPVWQSRMLALARRSLLTCAAAVASFILWVRPSWSPAVFRLHPDIRKMYQSASQQSVTMWLANDWKTLPVAMQLSREQGVAYAYDTHELAYDEYAHRRLWRIAQRPMIKAVEQLGMTGAAFVSCVSRRIAERLRELYSLKQTPLVLRNVPSFDVSEFRPTGPIVRVLYHGIVAEGRALEQCIRSVPFWPKDFTLTIRGPGAPHYLRSLQNLIDELQMSERITIAPPVPMTEMVARAAEFDVGLFVLPGHSLHNTYALPNKFFEYTMAGLALCVSDLPEMTDLMRDFSLGETIDGDDPPSIAAAIGRLDRTKIDEFKRNALLAARQLNWDVEGIQLVSIARERLNISRPASN